ncbi:MAG TPA: flagellar motor switch protein FliN [Pirellulales bacterium]
MELPDFTPGADQTAATTHNSLGDVELDLRIEVGRTYLKPEEINQLSTGSVVTLDQLARDPVNVFVNDQLIAHGEALILNERFCVRITELILPKATVPKLTVSKAA